MKRTIDMIDGTTRRLSLPTGITIDDKQFATGMTLESVFVGPRSGRVVIQTYSVWDDGTGRCRGRAWRELDAREIRWVAARYNLDVIAQDDMTA